MKPQVFVSYASEDREVALRIVESLKKQGISCWVDKEGIRFGQDYRPSVAGTVSTRRNDSDGHKLRRANPL